MRKLSKETRKKLSVAGRKGGLAKVPKGFAKMEKEKAKEIQSKGGRGKK